MLQAQHATITPTPHTMFFARNIYEKAVGHAEQRTVQQLEEVNAAAAAAAPQDKDAADQLRQSELAAEKRQTLLQPMPSPVSNIEELMAREAALKKHLKGEVAVIKDKASSYDVQEEQVHKRMAQRRSRMDEYEEWGHKVSAEKARLNARLQQREDQQDKDALFQLDTYGLRVQGAYAKMHREQIDDEMKMQKIREKKEKLMLQEENYMIKHHEHKQLNSELASLQQHQGQQKAPALATGLPSSGSQTLQEQMANDKLAMLHLEKLQENHKETMAAKKAAEEMEERLAGPEKEIAEERARLVLSQQEKQQQFEAELRQQQQRFLEEQEKELRALQEKERKLKAAVEVANEEKKLAEKREAQLAQERLQQQQAEAHAEEVRRQQAAEEHRLQLHAEEVRRQEAAEAEELRRQQAEEQRLHQQAEEQRRQQAAEEQRLHQQAEEQRLQQAAEEQRLQQAAEEQRLHQQAEEQRRQQQAELDRLQQEADTKRLQREEVQAQRFLPNTGETPWQPTLTLRERLAEEEEKTRSIVQELARKQALLRAEIAAEDRKETAIQQEMHLQEEERNTSQRLLSELAEREKKWSMEVDEDEDHKEPTSPASKKARTGHTPRVVLPPTAKYHPAPLQPGRVQSGFWPATPAAPVCAGPYQRPQPSPSPPAPEALQETHQHQQPQQEPVLVKAMPSLPPTYLGIF